MGLRERRDVYGVRNEANGLFRRSADFLRRVWRRLCAEKPKRGILKMEQNTEEWFGARLGKVTASRIAAVMSKGRNGATSQTRERYLMDLLGERLTGQHVDITQTAAMQWGLEQEGPARDTYSFMQGVDVEEVGFVNHPTIECTGASPDGLVGSTGLVEIKCPGAVRHIENLESQKIDSKYIYQMQWQMECLGREWCDFVSFNPTFPLGSQINVTRVERSAETISEMSEKVVAFLDELAAREAAIRKGVANDKRAA